MLARHLLFIATRRPTNNVLAISSDSITPNTIVQPSYQGSNKSDDKQVAQKYTEILKVSRENLQLYQDSNEKAFDNNHYNYSQEAVHVRDNYQRYYHNEENPRFFEHNGIATYSDRRSMPIHNAKNQQFYMSGKEFNQQFYTLPSRRPLREVEPPRSVTPDITRGLGRGSLSAMHMLARHGQKSIPEQDTRLDRSIAQADANRRNLVQLESRNRLVQQPIPTVDVKNRFTTPQNIAALGYRFFASSPISDFSVKSVSTDVLKHNPISPIAPGYNNGFKFSTPAGRSAQTVAERLALAAGTCSSLTPNSSGRSTPVQTSSGRNTPTNLILSPTKSTMSNEELFAAIHKSKRKLNIKDDNENMSPPGSMNSLVKTVAGSRHSWSPELHKSAETPQRAHSPSATSRLDFKRLLLQQSVKTGPTRLSAAEQLKLSRQQCQYQQQSASITQQMPLTKVLSPRSIWRFHTPRTDVLSSTIIEDTAAEEKAMKPSPENTSPILRLNSRKQLDLRANLQVPICKEIERQGQTLAEPNTKSVDIGYFESENVVKDESSTNCKSNDCANVNKNDEFVDLNRIRSFRRISSESISPLHHEVITATPVQYSQHSAQLFSRSQETVHAFESRRLSNQLARAQFLASTPINTNQAQSTYFVKHFRARSESPKHANSKNVARSPSAPTLETAL